MFLRLKFFAYIILPTIFTLGSLSNACVWVPEDGPTVYWPSTRIKVCFVEQNLPNLTDSSGKSFSSDLSRSHELIKQAIEEMSSKTRFSFHDFSKCDPNDSNPMIRINLSRGAGDGETQSIGPNSARTRPFNLTLSQLPIQEIEQRLDQQTGVTTAFDNRAWAKTATQHEVMHLLGFHHDMPRVNGAKGGGWDRFMSHQGQTRRVDDDFDANSVMNITGHGKELSDRDIVCINDLAQRTVRYNSVNTNPLTQGKPPSEPSEATAQKSPIVQSGSLRSLESKEPAAID